MKKYRAEKHDEAVIRQDAYDEKMKLAPSPAGVPTSPAEGD